MIKLSEKSIAKDARYRFDYPVFPVYKMDEVFREVGIKFHSSNTSKEEIDGKFNVVVNFLKEKSSNLTGKSWALNELLIRGIKLWKDGCRKLKLTSDIDERIHELQKEVPQNIRMFLDIDYAQPLPLNIVDALPEPFIEYGFEALNVRPNYYTGIPVGIYIPKTALSDETGFTLYHEHLHAAISPIDNKFHFIQWFDEGVADVVSFILHHIPRESLRSSIQSTLRKYFIDDNELLIRGWNAKMVAQLILNYGLDFFRFVIKLRSSTPEIVDWLVLYRAIKNFSTVEDLQEAFGVKLDKRIVDGARIDSTTDYVCKLIVSHEVPITISPLAYLIVEVFCDKDKHPNSKYAFVSYDEIASAFNNIEKKVIIDECEFLGDLLSISAEENGIRSWDTVGYYKEILKYGHVKANIL